ncbi:oxidoreductase [Streptomyces sp. NPDC059578]|uniref:oxidoreductase n=1 Tax=unclassified Streptomyces TaxID=2593676 RepID=UPI00364FABC6
MAAAYASFDLAPATRAGGVLANGELQAHRDFVDFIIDGRPLLYRLADLDAVSPLASDVPPAIFTAQVRGLLLEAPAPLADDRHIIYGCPECEDLACGAVTAVIERDATDPDDVIWRDFAWQTDRRVDLPLNGYHGMGPFRFRGAEYRAALQRLVEGTAPARRRVLLIGDRVAVLARLAAALRTIGIGADITRDAAQVPADELRAYGAVAFGASVPAAERTLVRATFDHAGLTVTYVDGLAPIVPLLVAQVEHALDTARAGRRRLTHLSSAGGDAGVDVSSTCRVRLLAYRLDRLRRTRTHEVFDGVLGPGHHRIPLDGDVRGGRSFLVARTTDSVLVAPSVR